MSTFRNNQRYGTRDPQEMRRLIRMLRDREKELGHRPNKQEVDSKELGAIKKVFGKWCYALEASGLEVPSEETVKRRREKAKRWDRKHAEARRRRKERYKRALDSEDTASDNDNTPSDD